MAVAFCSCGQVIRGEGGDVVVNLLKHQAEDHTTASDKISHPGLKPRRRRTVEQ